MDKIKAVLEEIDLKAARSTDTYELIVNLIQETSLKLQAYRVNDRFFTSEVIGRPEDCGQL
jgi:hypothetical protein